ncbi:hypothetical protein chiPu_0033734, partial [Chiloscyllium punctatum]|nr:hypothetical protein [Chiloscyllium punctatum]
PDVSHRRGPGHGGRSGRQLLLLPLHGEAAILVEVAEEDPDADRLQPEGDEKEPNGREEQQLANHDDGGVFLLLLPSGREELRLLLRPAAGTAFRACAAAVRACAIAVAFFRAAALRLRPLFPPNVDFPRYACAPLRPSQWGGGGRREKGENDAPAQ